MADNSDLSAIEAFQNDATKPNWSKPFPVIGKGTLFFNVSRTSPFFLAVRPDLEKVKNEKDEDSWIGLNVDKNRVSLLTKHNKTAPELVVEVKKSDFFGKNVGIEKGKTCTYWLSYDSDRMVVKYGKGYCTKKTTILPHEFTDKKDFTAFFDPTVRRKVEFYDKIIYPMAPGIAPLIDVEPEVDFDQNPFVSDRPLLVKDSSKANLFELDDDKFTFSSSLPPACQTLYANVIGVDVHLDFVHPDVDGYEFPLSTAIGHSIKTEGCLLYNKLKEKEKESDGKFGYLRVTLGNEFGNSPGVPYVLELWPSKHGSPVHNHGNTYAVIRVLHGGLTIHYYNKLSESTTRKQLGQIDVKKDDITWISPRWYQTHQLQNDTDDFCATIQCYSYGTSDNIHWPYFDYLQSCSTIAEFTPDSDFKFKEMYDKVMKEYEDARRPLTRK